MSRYNHLLSVARIYSRKYRIYRYTNFALTDHDLWTQVNYTSEVRPKKCPFSNQLQRLAKACLSEKTIFTGVSAGWGYCASFNTSGSSDQLVLFNKDSWFGSHLPTSSSSNGCVIDLPEVVKDVSCGRNHLLVLSTSGKVYSIGSNALGQCGIGEGIKARDDLPLNPLTPITKEFGISQISCGLDHSLFLTEEGKVLSCGWSADGQTGTGSNLCVPLPTPVHGFLSDHVGTRIHTRADSCFVITDDSKVFAWGNNEYGQLGLSPKEYGPQICTPVQVSLGLEFVAMATGGSFTAFLTKSGEILYCGFGLGAEVSNKEDVNEFACLRHLHTLSVDEVEGARIEAGLHFLALTTQRGLTIWGRMDGFHHRKTEKITDLSEAISVHVGIDGLYVVNH